MGDMLNMHFFNSAEAIETRLGKKESSLLGISVCHRPVPMEKPLERIGIPDKADVPPFNQIAMIE